MNHFFKSLFLVLVAISLIARTYADVWMITNSTCVESAIIGRSTTLFKEYLGRFAYAMPLVNPLEEIRHLPIPPPF